MASFGARRTVGLLLVVFLAACSGANDKPPPAGDAGGADRPADHAVAVDAGTDAPADDVGSADRPTSADTGGGTPIDPNPMCDPANEHLWKWSGMTANGEVRWALNRCAWNVCAGGCAVGDVYFALTYNGRSDAARGSDIAYTRTHHNWNDSLIATLPDRVLKWRIVVDESASTFKPKYFVSVQSRTGASILPETETGVSPCVPPTGCGG